MLKTSKFEDRLMEKFFELKTGWRDYPSRSTITVGGITSIAYHELDDIDVQVREQEKASVSMSEPSVIGRLDFGYRLGYDGLPQNEAAACKHLLSYYLRTNLYVDTMGFSPAGIKQCVELFGPDRILFGTDYPAVNISQKEHIDMIRGMDLSDEDKDKIFWKTAKDLLKLM